MIPAVALLALVTRGSIEPPVLPAVVVTGPAYTPTTVPQQGAPSSARSAGSIAQPPAAVEGTPATAPTGWGCVAANAYLSTHTAPGFTWICTDTPGATIMGNQAATCIPPNPNCTAGPEIAIADPCPAAYMNEASNSWVLAGLSDAPIDPYGSCG